MDRNTTPYVLNIGNAILFIYRQIVTFWGSDSKNSSVLTPDSEALACKDTPIHRFKPSRDWLEPDDHVYPLEMLEATALLSNHA